MAVSDYDADATELLETYDFLMKYIIIGEAGTGKTCLLHQFTHNSFKDHSQHTIGVEFSSRTVKLGEKRIKLQVSSIRRRGVAAVALIARRAVVGYGGPGAISVSTAPLAPS
ncbi:Ras-related protein Rab-4B [Trametes pubescens]|uniref:Ras-related protein Rab-4B n=1 Tax=Trametes pubescens TaxID=154538 RepID=A0A1M2VAN7_TRAPU|nr:Ras-related protein Rab-4B [Trametes pubescens]